MPDRSEIVVPSVVHWKENHYAAIVDEREGEYLVKDPTFYLDRWIPKGIVHEESSGYFLIPANRAEGKSFEVVSEQVSAGIRGRGYPTHFADDIDEICPKEESEDQTEVDESNPISGIDPNNDEECIECPQFSNGGTGSPEDCVTAEGCGADCRGMPVWSVSEPYINLWVQDTPVFYTQRSGKVDIDYDYQGRVISKDYDDGGKDEFVYSNKGLYQYKHKETTAITRTYTYTRDELGRPTSVDYPDGTDIDYEYSAAGDLEILKDGRGKQTTWEYDPEGRMEKKYDQDGVHIAQYYYDDNSRVTNKWTKAKGTTSYSYNKVGNLIFVNYPTGTSDVNYYYDNAHRLISIVDGIGNTSMSYTSGGRLAYEDGPWSSDRVTYTYTDGYRTRMALQRPGTSNWIVDYEYDLAHRLTKVTSPSGVYDYNYTGIGGKVDNLNINPTGSGTDLKIEYTYDPVNRIEKTQLKQGSTILNKHEYSYNLAGWATSHKLPSSGTAASLSHDEIGQLETATGYNGTNYTYAYDDGRNLGYRIRGGTTENFSVNNTNEYTLTHNGTSWSDDNGNLVSDGSSVYQYDAADRLIQVDYHDGTYYQREKFYYDGLNRLRRIYTEYSTDFSTWIFGEDIRLVYDGRQIIQERTQTNAVIATYTRGKDISGSLSGAGGIGGILSRSNSTSTTHGYYHSDNVGAVTKIVSSAGANYATYQYDPYGFQVSQSGHFSWVNTNPFRYSTKYYMESGNNYFGYRFYNADLHRWLNRDPLGEKGGINLYGYVSNNPSGLIDPCGLDVYHLILCGPPFDALPLAGHELIIVGNPKDGYTILEPFGGFFTTNATWQADEVLSLECEIQSYPFALSPRKEAIFTISNKGRHEENYRFPLMGMGVNYKIMPTPRLIRTSRAQDQLIIQHFTEEDRGPLNGIYGPMLPGGINCGVWADYLMMKVWAMFPENQVHFRPVTDMTRGEVPVPNYGK